MNLPPAPMANLTVPAPVVVGNEKAYSYYEINSPDPTPGAGMRRVRIIEVNRNGRLAEFRQDLGPAKNFKGSRQLAIPSLFEHSVDELIGLAEELRYETKQDKLDILDLLGVEEPEKVKVV